MNGKNSKKTLLVIAGSVLLTGAALYSRADAQGPGCFNGGNCGGNWPWNEGTCIGTLYNGGSPYCACAYILTGESFGTYQCSPYPPPAQ